MMNLNVDFEDYDMEVIEELYNKAELHKDMYHWIVFAKSYIYTLCKYNSGLSFVEPAEMENMLLGFKRQHYKIALALYTVYNMAIRLDEDGYFECIMIPATRDVLDCLKYYKKAFKNNINFSRIVP